MKKSEIRDMIKEEIDMMESGDWTVDINESNYVTIYYNDKDIGAWKKSEVKNLVKLLKKAGV